MKIAGNEGEKTMRFRGVSLLIALWMGFISISACEKGKKAENTVEKEGEAYSNIVTLTSEAVEKAGIKIAPVSIRTMKTELSFPGKVSVNETRLAHVGPRISGRAVEVSANLGDLIKKGQPLALIDSPELGEAQSQYLKAKTNLQVAERSYERAKMLLDGKVISTGEFQRREGEYLSARTEAKAAEDRLHLFGMTDYEVLAIGKGHALSSRVSIYAPISGTVTERHLTIGEVVEPVKPLFIIADLSTLWVIADIPENDISKIREGQKVSVLVSSYPDTEFTGIVTYISDSVDPQSRTVKVRAEVENPKGVLKPEMFAAVKITAGKTDALAIPESAVQREGERTIVFVEKSETAFEKRDASLGPETGGFHQVISGLMEGERIVTEGAFTLKSETLKGLMEEE